MSISFLLGSGISIGADLPSMSGITDEVLFGNYRRGSNDSFRPSESTSEIDVIGTKAEDEMHRIQTFLRWLGARAGLRYEPDYSRVVNYEDLAYLAGQIYDDCFGEYENPAIAPFIDEALASLWEVLAKLGTSPTDKLGTLAGDAVDFIRDVLGIMLAQATAKASRTEHLKMLVNAALEAGNTGLNVFTLNHDRLLEGYLQASNVDVVDGFGREDVDLGIRRWNPDLLDRGEAEKGPFVRLFKLHGSLGWRRIRPETPGEKGRTDAAQERSRQDEYVGIRSNADLKGKADHSGRVHKEVGRSLVLAGTFNKMLDYTRHIFLEHHYRFHRFLADSTNLVVCGYGFGDKGINGRIAEWMCVSPESATRRMQIIDWRTLKETRNAARPAIAREICGWKKRKALIYRRCDFTCEAVGWEEIKSNLSNAT